MKHIVENIRLQVLEIVNAKKKCSGGSDEEEGNGKEKDGNGKDKGNKVREDKK